MFSLKASILSRRNETDTDFYTYLAGMKDSIRQRMESDDAMIDLAQRALIGDSKAVLTSLHNIERYLREQPYGGLLPKEYRSLDITGALFQEWIGYATAFPWFTQRAHSNSSKLQIVGPQIFMSEQGEYKLYPHAFSSSDRVEQLQRSIIRHDPSVRLDRAHPSAELKIDDPLWPGRFIRAAIWVAPRVWEGFTTMTFRRQIVEYMTLEDQAGSGMIPYDGVEPLRNLVATYPNLLVSGPVESGKSTLANTFVGEQLAQAEFSTGVIMIEKHPESTLPLLIKGHRFIPIQAEDHELMNVGIQSLRHDPDIVFMTEMRWSEWQFYNYAGEKGHRGLIGTYHTKDAEDIPYQGAFAVYAGVGGSLKGHLMATLKSCELVAVLEPLRHGKKKLTRLCEIRFDGESGRVYANDWMRWDPDAERWQYNADIAPELWNRMVRKNAKAAEAFRSSLEKLAAKSPLKDPLVESLKSRAVLSGGG